MALARARQALIPLIPLIPLALLCALPGAAFAESAAVLPGGAQAVYVGAGLSTFASTVSGGPEDRQLRGRIDLYAAAGLGRRLQLSADAPLIYNTYREIEGVGPCPNPNRPGYCDPVYGAGEAGVHLRGQALWEPVAVALGVGLRSDAWNEGTRDRWTNAGQGVTSIVATAVLGDRYDLGPARLGWTAYGHYAFVFGREVPTALGAERLPADQVKAGAELTLGRGRVEALAGLSASQRLGGVDVGPEWREIYLPTPDLWAALRYKEIRAEAKLSLALGAASGLHLNVGRTVWAVNGASGVTDLAFGWHRYFPPRGA